MVVGGSTRKRPPQQPSEKEVREGVAPLRQTSISFPVTEKKRKKDSTQAGEKREYHTGGMKSSRTKGPNFSKKLTIKMSGAPTSLPPDYHTKTWAKLKDAVIAVFEEAQDFSNKKEALYKDVEFMCIHRFHEYMLQNLYELMKDFISKEVLQLLNRTNETQAFLSVVDKLQQSHNEKFAFIRSIFLYLDRKKIQENVGYVPIFETALDLFRRRLSQEVAIEKKIGTFVLMSLEAERNGDVVEKSALRNVIRFLSSLKLYETCIEVPYLEHSTTHFKNGSGHKVATMSVSEYLIHVEKVIQEEKHRAEYYLEARSIPAIMQLIYEHFISHHAHTIVGRGFDEFVESDRKDDLRRLFAVLSKTNQTSLLCNHMSQLIKKMGEAVVCDKEKEKEMVPSLLDLKLQFEGIVEQCFDNERVFWDAIRTSFESFVNSRQNKPAELLAKYIDTLLKAGGNKGMTEKEVEAKLDSALVIFKYVRGKDVFEAFYKKDLAKRLLLHKSASFDNEKAMLLKLKEECGGGFTSKLEGMFKDMTLSSDMMNEYKAYTEKLAAASGVTSAEEEAGAAQTALTHANAIDLSVSILTTGFWPPYSAVTLNLPEDLALCQKQFQDFYLQKHNSRKLVWQHSLGHCIVTAHFPKIKGVRELILSLYQSTVLLLFNSSDRHTFKDIVDLTGLDRAEAERTVQSLALGKVKVLKRKSAGEGKSKNISDSDLIIFNSDFTSPQRRIKINAIQIKETKEEAEETTSKVMEDRLHQIDAAVVRIMKARKSMKHQELIGEALVQVRFPAKAGDVKKRIESLIERDYLERDEEDKTLFRYLA
eukprot:CAMPEP_0113885364 /NCGR_PEP_ID=MMETSP0780_2-20120614/10865_1 /TAXON_ID=652834 /ORGANISM="Palpitomonas bilix" /LENGTH=816 /DNA_ID=CAMNT_0000873273 /DNA_START=158 /DNA_END=2608 /DNA_ORIENTATION=- /assembly_acc=CAM_ASM_000599